MALSKSAAGFLCLALLCSALFTGGAALFLPMAPPSGRCPVNALGFSVCSSLFGGLVNVNFGNLPRPAGTPCCTLIAGLASFDAEVCLCTAFNANVFGPAYSHECHQRRHFAPQLLRPELHRLPVLIN
ncbi:pEARLI1-like lipid transfer protein 3 [Curcuma longa]|uniref:pEARLI1-like lipid transfer protein 3 n=1 Tax=Curcuma longa TaxID=136217 RepID=UPI003D9F6F22